MNTRYKKHLEAFKNTVVSVVSSDHGPISLTCICAKVMERIIHEEILSKTTKSDFNG